jgi:hypothetical protein
MNGRKARALRTKGELSPALRQERRERIGVIAAARNEVYAEAKAEYDAAEATARNARNAKMNEAEAKFDEQRTAIRADIDKKATEVEKEAAAA